MASRRVPCAGDRMDVCLTLFVSSVCGWQSPHLQDGMAVLPRGVRMSWEMHQTHANHGLLSCNSLAPR